MMNPLLTQLMQQLAFSAGRNNPDPMAFDNLLRGGDLVDEYGRPVDVGGQRMPDPRKRPPMFRAGDRPNLMPEPAAFFSVPPEQIPAGFQQGMHLGDYLAAQRKASGEAPPEFTYENGKYVSGPNGGLVRKKKQDDSQNAARVAAGPDRGPVDASIREVAAIADKLRGLPTMESERVAAESQARQNVINERDRINSGLKSRNAAAMAGRESPVRPQTLEQQLTAAMKNVETPSAKDRLNEILPQEPGSQVKIKGASGNGNQLVRLSDGTAMMMGPEAYREYKNALAEGLDEKTAMRSVQRSASGRSAVANAGGRARELVRTQGAASLANKPELSKAITPEEVASISVDRTARLAENAAKVQQRQDRANPLLAMMRNDGTDSPIAQMFMYRQMGASPDDALRAYLQTQAMKQQGDISKSENDLRARTLDQQALDTKERTKAAQMRAELEFMQGVTDPSKRRAMEDDFGKRYGIGQSSGESLTPQVLELVPPGQTPQQHANNIAKAARNGAPKEVVDAAVALSEKMHSENRSYLKPPSPPTSQVFGDIRRREDEWSRWAQQQLEGDLQLSNWGSSVNGRIPL